MSIRNPSCVSPAIDAKRGVTANSIIVSSCIYVAVTRIIIADVMTILPVFLSKVLKILSNVDLQAMQSINASMRRIMVHIIIVNHSNFPIVAGVVL